MFEGPAGPPLEADCPPTDLGQYALLAKAALGREEPIFYREGTWRSDARKRTAMLEYAHRFGEHVWVIWLDADELLVNGEWLRDWLQYLQWHDDTHPDEPPNARCPVKLIELDGSISTSLVKIVRADLIRDYTLSIANVTDLEGRPAAAGNFHAHIASYLSADPGRARKFEEGFLYWPPGPGPLDPFIVHRSMLRHPLRAGLRMNEQEARELAAHRDTANG